ncbi:hypothetical protein OAH46_00265 [Verrucomicrobia bacterium]|nr:hypothetical protein [Verrucomicrobiota bacterium]
MKSKVNDRFIFHAQSSLSFLIITQIINLITKKEIKIIYDVHDILLRRTIKTSSIKQQLHNTWYFYKLFQEKYLVSKHTTIITVSESIKNYLQNTYCFENVTTILNLPLFTAEGSYTNKTTIKKPFVFFGTLERMPKINKLENEFNPEIDLYGKQFKINKIEIEKINPHFHVINEYTPENLKFLHYYEALILFNPLLINKNFEFSLPNKFFQSLFFGLKIYCSSNYKEMLCNEFGFKGITKITSLTELKNHVCLNSNAIKENQSILRNLNKLNRQRFSKL